MRNRYQAGVARTSRPKGVGAFAGICENIRGCNSTLHDNWLPATVLESSKACFDRKMGTSTRGKTGGLHYSLPLAKMRKREEIVAFVLVAGLALVIAAIHVEMWLASSTASYIDRISATGEWLRTQLVRWGFAVTLIGIFLLLIVYLTRRWGRERSYSYAKIVALFCTDQQGEIIVYPQEYAPNELHYYVHLALPNGESDEFECSYALFQRLKEGMTGRAVCKGNQLLAFHACSEGSNPSASNA